jgi:flavodoxin
MPTLIVFYSRTGITRKVAQELGPMLSADIEEIVDTKSRAGALGYLGGGKDAAMKNPATIQPALKDPSQYDLVVIGTPVWAFTVSPAVRTWLTQNAAKLRQAAFYCTMGGSGDERTFQEMERLVGKRPVNVLTLIDKDVKADRHKAAIETFAKSLALPH